MPSCKFFLEGLCARENCPYRHVKVNPNAEICPEYLRGFCSAGQECKRRHVSRCPQFERTGLCARGRRCPYPHTSDRSEAKGTAAAAVMPATVTARSSKKRVPKTPPPPKPKRKSMGSATVENKKARTRYFEEKVAEEEVEDQEGEESNETSALSNSLEAKRKRLLKKVELAKQAWAGVAPQEEKRAEDKEEDMDDSGPYEEIDEEDEPAREPIGDLPAFIPLETGGDAQEDEERGTEEDEKIDERLI